jgi:hypothetical protein
MEDMLEAPAVMASVTFVIGRALASSMPFHPIFLTGHII